jgi:hypothetical protein
MNKKILEINLTAFITVTFLENIFGFFLIIPQLWRVVKKVWTSLRGEGWDFSAALATFSVISYDFPQKEKEIYINFHFCLYNFKEWCYDIYENLKTRRYKSHGKKKDFYGW